MYIVLWDSNLAFSILADSFLSQLRAFQQMRGTVLNPSQVEQSLDNIIHALRQTMEQLLPTNTHWFAELFTDLLLQIGLVPMQELDADILKNVADKERLQVCRMIYIVKFADWFISRIIYLNLSCTEIT